MTGSTPSSKPGKTEREWSSLRKRAIRGSVWWAGIYPFSKAIQIGSNVILAGLLSPVAFGVVALGTVVVRAITMFSEIGIRFAVIQSSREDEAFLNTAWTMQIVRGVLICAAAALLAGPMSRFYGEAQLASIVPVVGLVAIVNALQSTNHVTLNRQLREKPRALLELALNVVTRASMIAVALIWPTAWALVFGTLAGTIFFTTATHFLPGPRNRLQWDPEAARALFRFGFWVFIGTVIAFLGTQLDKLILGKLVSEHLESLGLVGVYVMAQRVARLPLEATQLLGGQMALPVLSEIGRSERHRFEERLIKIRRVVLAPSVALCLGVVVLAPGFFALLYDDRYQAARWMAPLLTISVWLGLLNSFVSKALLSLGQTRALAITGFINVVASTIGGLVGFHVADVPGFIVGLACGNVIQHAAELGFLAKQDIRVLAQDVRYTVIFVVPASACAVCHTVFEAADSPAGVRYGVGLVVPLLLFASVSLWASRRVWRVVKPR